MITIKYEHLIATHIQQTLQELGDSKSFNVKTAYQIHKMLVSIVKERMHALKRYEALSKFASKDDKGHPMRTPATGEFVIPAENQTAYEAALKELFETEFVLEQNKLNYQELGAVKFSPREIAAIAPLVEGLESGEQIPSLSLAPKVS